MWPLDAFPSFHLVPQPCLAGANAMCLLYALLRSFLQIESSLPFGSFDSFL